MFEFELPCDWSVNRRPHSANSNNNNNNNNNGGNVEKAANAKKEEKVKYKTKVKQQQHPSTNLKKQKKTDTPSETTKKYAKKEVKCDDDDDDDEDDDDDDDNDDDDDDKVKKKGVSSGSSIQSSKNNNSNKSEKVDVQTKQQQKQQINNSAHNNNSSSSSSSNKTGREGGSDNHEGNNNNGGGDDNNNNDNNNDGDVPKIITANALGPKSTLKLDKCLHAHNHRHNKGGAAAGGDDDDDDDEEEDSSDDDNGGSGGGGDKSKKKGASQQQQQPKQPWSGKVKLLVIKNLHNANQLEEIQHKRSRDSYIDTESLLSKLPYKKMLSDMFGGNLRGNLQTSVIPYVTRAYEEAFMHEPTNSSERECARGKQCECMFIDRMQPFTAVEFLLPGEQAPSTPHLCVLCCRAITQQLYYDVVFDKCEFPGTIQRFGNIHSEPGEYALDAMLIASSTAPVHIMPLPIVSHQRNRYTVHVVGGIKRLKQSRVYFHKTPSCSANNGQ